jgi:hypothetical protein
MRQRQTAVDVSDLISMRPAADTFYIHRRKVCVGGGGIPPPQGLKFYIVRACKCTRRHASKHPNTEKQGPSTRGGGKAGTSPAGRHHPPCPPQPRPEPWHTHGSPAGQRHNRGRGQNTDCSLAVSLATDTAFATP